VQELCQECERWKILNRDSAQSLNDLEKL